MDLHPPSAAAGAPRGARRAVATAAVMSALVINGLESTAVTGVMPAISRELGGAALYPWLFTGFLVASAAAVPVAGALGDRYGRRPVFAAGMALFLAASALAALAPSMPALVAARALQGLGAGVLAPVVTTLSADLYPLRERAKVQGLFTGAWGAANVAGPFVAAALVDALSWRWVFGLVLPFGLASVALLWGSGLGRPQGDSPRPIEPGGSIALAVSAGALLFALDLQLGVGPLGRALCLALAAAAAFAFVRHQRRSASPFLPPGRLGEPLVRAGVGASLLAGALLYTLTAYVPLWVAGSYEGGARAAGAALVPLLGGWALGSTFGVRALVRWGAGRVVAGGFAAAACGLVALASIAYAGGPLGAAMGALAVAGVGLGPAANAPLLKLQERAAWHERAAMTSVVQAARTLGGSLAVGLAAPLGGPDRFAALAVGLVLALPALARGFRVAEGRAGRARALAARRRARRARRAGRAAPVGVGHLHVLALVGGELGVDDVEVLRVDFFFLHAVKVGHLARDLAEQVAERAEQGRVDLGPVAAGEVRAVLVEDLVGGAPEHARELAHRGRLARRLHLLELGLVGGEVLGDDLGVARVRLRVEAAPLELEHGRPQVAQPLDDALQERGAARGARAAGEVGAVQLELRVRQRREQRGALFGGAVLLRGHDGLALARVHLDLLADEVDVAVERGVLFLLRHLAHPLPDRPQVGDHLVEQADVARRARLPREVARVAGEDLVGQRAEQHELGLIGPRRLRLDDGRALALVGRERLERVGPQAREGLARHRRLGLLDARQEAAQLAEERVEPLEVARLARQARELLLVDRVDVLKFLV
jgi:MFS family permease